MLKRIVTLALVITAFFTQSSSAQTQSAVRNDLPQPYRTTRDWGELPPGVKWAAVTAVEPAPDGTIYVIHRCFANSCAGRKEAPILKYDADGKLLKSWGEGMFIFPHGATVDRDGNLWVTDARGENGKGHQVFKFSPEGKVLMTLGKAGVSGSGPDLFDQPTDVVVAPNGDIFVTDSHRNGKNNRVVSSPRTASSSRNGAGRGPARESSASRTPSRWTRAAGCSSATARTTASRSSIRTAAHRRMAAVRTPERHLDHEGRHDLRRRLGVGPRHRRARAPGHQEGHPHRQREDRRRSPRSSKTWNRRRRSLGRRRRRRRRAGQCLRRRRPPPDARAPRKEIT